MTYFALDSYETDQVRKQDEILIEANAENVKLTNDLVKDEEGAT